MRFSSSPNTFNDFCGLFAVRTAPLQLYIRSIQMTLSCSAVKPVQGDKNSSIFRATDTSKPFFHLNTPQGTYETRSRDASGCKGKSRSRDRATNPLSNSLSCNLRLQEKRVTLDGRPFSLRTIYTLFLPWVSPDFSPSSNQSTRTSTYQSSLARRSPLTHMVGCIRAYMRVLRMWPPGRRQPSAYCSSPRLGVQRKADVSFDA